MLDIEKKIEFIKKLAEKHDISAYEIGHNTNISSSSAHKIFSGEQKNPRNKTLNIILDYIEKRIAGSENNYQLKEEFKTKAAEDAIDYKSKKFYDLKIDDKLNIIFRQQKKINQKLNIITEELFKLNS